MRSTPRALAALGLALACVTAAPGAPGARKMAITIDDLPYHHDGPDSTYLASAQSATARLLAALRAHHATAVAFVIEGQLTTGPERRSRIALLQQWVDAGMTLGNHTFSHPDFNQVSVDRFEQEIVDGEQVWRSLMQARGPYRPYFRHPMNHAGDTREKKEALEAFLAARGYTVAPHTIENSDFLFNPAYLDGVRHGDAAYAARIRDLYLTFTIDATAFAERISARIFGREVPQTLLIHANDLNADALDEMLRRFEARGYRFVSLDEAMTDAAYRTRDTYVGATGPTWLFRWSRSLGQRVSFAGDPPMPSLPRR